jgi:membrane associated rhomboid family serine protease
MVTYLIIGITALISINAFRNRDLFARLMLNPYQVYHRKQVFRMVSHGFMHADWNHLIFNMLSLFFFGGLVENELGVALYICLYMGGMVFASLGSLFKHKDNIGYNSVGASGAVSAVVFASILFYPWNRLMFIFLPIPIPAVVFGIIYLVYSHYMSRKNVDNINHDAHILGAVFGLTFPILINQGYLTHFIDQLLNFR